MGCRVRPGNNPEEPRKIGYLEVDEWQDTDMLVVDMSINSRDESSLVVRKSNENAIRLKLS